MIDSASSGVRETATTEEAATRVPGGSIPPIEASVDASVGRTEAFDAYVEEIRRRLGSNILFLFPNLEDRIRRRLGVAPKSSKAAALAVFVGVGIRLALVLFATALAGDWAGIPWGRWVVILAFFAIFDATQPSRTPPLDVPPGPKVRQWMEDWTALLPTVVRESDLRELASVARRWVRLRVGVAVGVAVAAILLLTCWLFEPAAMSDLHAGTIVLLAFLLYDLGAGAINPVDWAFIHREAGYDHHLFWPSPVDSPEVQKAMRMSTFFGFATGMWITLYLVLTLVLVSWGSPLVLPLGVGFIVIGYLYAICATLGWRASIQKIVERARSRRLAGLRRRIESFEPRYSDLSPMESEHARGLIDLYNMIRDAATTPTTTHTLVHTAVGLIIPTIMFVIAVFGEVYAERFLDAILP